MYAVIVSRTFQKQFQKLSSVMKKRVRIGLSELGEDPFTLRAKADVKVLEGTDPLKRRLRVGDYRIIFHVEKRTVNVIEIFSRGRGY